MWPRVIGQRRVKNVLLSALRTKRLPHAYLFFGSDGVGKDAMALELARVLHCEEGGDEACGKCASCLKVQSLQHPDVLFVAALPVGKGEKSDDSPLAKLTEPEIRTIQEQFKRKAENPYHRIVIPKASIIKINSIREVRRVASMSTSDARKRVCIISRADEMGDEASNTLLKTLEEPSGNTMLILTVSHRETLLPTIVSRCQSVRFDALSEEDIREALIDRERVQPAQADLVARLSNGSYQRAVELLEEDFASQRKDVLSYIRHVLGSNITTLMEDIERIAGPRDRQGVIRFLTLVLMWFRDALVLSHGGAIINADQESELKSFVSKFPNADLLQVVAEVERAISLVGRNVYITLVLVHMSVQLKAHITTPRTAELQNV